MQLMECPAEDDYVTSVAWAADGKHVSVGTSSAQVQVGVKVSPHIALCQASCGEAPVIKLLPFRHLTSG